jgi:hypothetical protein
MEVQKDLEYAKHRQKLMKRDGEFKIIPKRVT